MDNLIHHTQMTQSQMVCMYHTDDYSQHRNPMSFTLLVLVPYFPLNLALLQTQPRD
ncbi:hypothetical protein RchiOBHm_Chr5g0083971 [Rosa chinensis]|uniref:Uncharacterized protein n=1 Tax=Rosa chinensis TaxID=74649 RepID=A0A2P6QNR2_ROSCH|nr:hypothetical protein RchiOBHm_Chr5g0083971 [Rosa chinensis]